MAKEKQNSGSAPLITGAKASSSRKKAEEDAFTLRHLVHSMEEAERKLEDFYKKNKVEDFNKTKRVILQLNEKISEMLK